MFNMMKLEVDFSDDTKNLGKLLFFNFLLRLSRILRFNAKPELLHLLKAYVDFELADLLAQHLGKLLFLKA